MKEDHTFWHKNIQREENSKSSDFWDAQRKVWFQKNDDKKLTKAELMKEIKHGKVRAFLKDFDKNTYPPMPDKFKSRRHND